MNETGATLQEAEVLEVQAVTGTEALTEPVIEEEAESIEEPAKEVATTDKVIDLREEEIAALKAKLAKLEGE